MVTLEFLNFRFSVDVAAICRAIALLHVAGVL